MSKFDHKKIMPRYSAFAIMLTIGCVAVLAKALYTMTAKRSYWEAVADRVKRDSLAIKPARGNILSCDGQLLASTLPEYKVFVDFHAMHESETDTLWNSKVDSICKGLHDIFPQLTAAQFKSHLNEGKKKESMHWEIWDKRIDYNTFTRVKALPIFRLKTYKGGFHYEEFNARKRPNGSLASRTIGTMFGAKDSARFGLELFYDNILRGTDGVRHRRKVLNKFLNITDVPPTDGADIVTTIDVNMQDLAERSVINKLKEIDGNVGVAIVMEVKTGDIKAIVNMERCNDGQYREIKNHAVTDLIEPGSVFKTVSVMAALEDGVCDTTFTIPTGNGIWHVYGRDLKDSHWRTGGYGTISLGKAMEVSSNIGIGYMADKFYHNNPEKFVKSVYRTGINNPNIRIPIDGHAVPRIRMPKRLPNGQYQNWSKTALLWMAFGYETQIPPIYTLTFYNAIANNGVMMQPRFVKEAVKNGEVVATYPPEVVKGSEHIASDKTIKITQDLLRRVVTNGTGKKAYSDNFWVCGKTGTAMIASNGSYGAANHLLTFAGWFGEKDNPMYSCIVCIQKTGLPAFGWMSGEVFKTIAEGIMAKYVKYDITDARDYQSILIPDVKDGNILAADYVLSHLGIQTNKGWGGSYSNGNPIWGRAKRNGQKSVSLTKVRTSGLAYVPDVYGMGARDAVFIMESRGIKVNIVGRGKVVKQSLEPGRKISKGICCTLTME